MFQRHIREVAGRFLRCADCRTEPRHIAHHGRSRRETMRHDVPTVRHSLECGCGRCTGLHETLDLAEDEWGKRFTQMPLILPHPSKAKVVRMRRRSGHVE
jgi:hypothetical protein